MIESKHKISILVPNNIYEKLLLLGYRTITEAVIKQLESSFIRSDQIEPDNNKIQSDYNILAAIVEERNRHIAGLEEHNRILKQDLQDLKEMHNNYMLQIQSLINQRAIEAPNSKRPWWKIW